MNIKITLTIVLSTFLTLTGCASSSEPSPEMEQITNQQAEIETLKVQQVELQEQLAVWQEMQPNVERLVAIEDELKILIQQLRDLTKENKMKAREAKRKLREARPFYMLQIASLNNLDNLKKMWESKQKSHPEILNGLPARYQQIAVKGKQYYRLKAGEFNHKAKAVETCQALKAQQVSCIVVNNTGKKL